MENEKNNYQLSTLNSQLKKPQLRFPEFEGEWGENNLERISTKNISYGIVQTGKMIAGGIQCVRVIDLTNGEIIKKDLITTSNKISNSYKKTILEKNELMIALRGKIGLTQVVKDELVGCNLTRGIARVAPNKKLINATFLSIFLNCSKTQKVFDKRKNGSALKEIPIGELKKFPIKYPTLSEQTKIANFLTAVDKRINLLQKKKAELEQYKKGVMQKLFSQEIRFKPSKIEIEELKKNGKIKLMENGEWKIDNGCAVIFNSQLSTFIYEDWEEKKLGEVCKKESSNISANSLSENNGNYKIYGATGYLQNVDFYREEEPYISIVKDGAGVGRTLLCEEKSSVLGTLDIIKPKNENNLEFLYSLINQIRFDKYITGSTIPHIYFKDYSKEKVNIPVPKEQQKIANFLSSIDKSINNLQLTIDNSQLFKKGLLQKMFV